MNTSFPNLHELLEVSGEVARILDVQALVCCCANAEGQLTRAGYGVRLLETQGG
ncbi:MAG: hypothetical protein IPM03_17580 [Sulfuritalea sp.]|nr:hypothetical protein [Sulfuritalea sp.]